MNVSMTLTLDGILRALRGRVHTLADEILTTGRANLNDGNARAERQDQHPRTGRDDRARR